MSHVVNLLNFEMPLKMKQKSREIKGSFLGGSDAKESACNAGDLGSLPGWGRSPGEGDGNPLQYSCLENPTDRGALQATVQGGRKESDRADQLTLSLGKDK